MDLILKKLIELTEMQKRLDKAIEEKHGLTYTEGKYTLEGLKRALIDELGEMNHEDKYSWCWWKKTQTQVDREKLLEELVDAWHFALSIAYHEFTEFSIYKYAIELEKNLSISEIIANIIKNENTLIEDMLVLSHKLGFTLDEVYEAYLKKNAVNHERNNTGY